MSDPQESPVAPTRLDALRAQETLSMLMGVFEMARLGPSTASRVLPLTIIGGFLGSGKTTLVNALLANPRGRKIAVLVNDFAEVNIDEQLISFRSDDVIGLTNGCACCATNGELVRALRSIATRPDLPDAIVLEASGLADPRGIAQVALAHPATRLDAFVTVVDGESFPTYLDDERFRPTVLSQLSAADIVLISKTDLLPDEGIGVRELVQSRAPDRTVLGMAHGDVPLEFVLGSRHGDAEELPDGAVEHGHGFISGTWTWDEPVERAALTSALRNLPEYVVRAKGVFHFRGDERCHTYQRVGARASFTVEPVGANVDPRSRLVLIGFSSQWERDDLAARLDLRG